MDQDLVTANSVDNFDEWDSIVTKRLRLLKTKPAIKRCALPLGEWPSYTTVQSSRQYISNNVNEGDDDEDPFGDFADLKEDDEDPNVDDGDL
jgi:hypothetical protein